MRKIVLGVALGLALAVPAMAEDVALLLVGRNYDRQSDLRSSRDILGLSDRLREAGFSVASYQDLTSEELVSRVEDMRPDLEAADRLVVVVAGHVATDGQRNWFLGREARAPSSLAIGRVSLPLRPLMDIAGGKPGAAVIAVAPSQRGTRLGAGLEQGYLPVDIPQGVTVISGPPGGLSDFILGSVLEPGVRIGRALEDAPAGVAGFGFLPTEVPFLPVVAAAPAPDQLDPADRLFWERMERIDTADAYENYLSRYPQGAYADRAEARLDELSQSPQAKAEAAEAALGLNRDARREIQRNLSILGFDTRGVDGIFGRGTRAAIAAWQASIDQDQTGFLTGNQISRLQISAAVRARELEEEAARRQEEQDRQDGAYWRDTGRGESEVGLRAYLARYPDGLFSDVARERLDAIEAASRQSAERTERDFWADVREADSASAYGQYLERYPNGVFADEAAARKEALERAQETEGLVAQARAEEARVLGNPITRLLVERRLQQLGFDVGNADGRFDDDTRRAIRRYQRSRELDVTGYVTQATLVRILAGGG